MASEGRSVADSPDPLGLSLDSSGYPSSRRVTRSQRSTRFISLGGSVSPRKQTFELEVGDASSPQKLLVTVEADGSSSTVSRKLFTSPTPLQPAIRRRERTTTTTVPLKSVEEEENGTANTPKRRGRPPKAGGAGATPKSATKTTRKRAGTPIRRTPGQARKAKTASAEDSEGLSVQATPRPRGRPRKTPTEATPAASESEAPPSSRSKSTRGGRQRRLALIPQEFGALTGVPMEDSMELETPYAMSESDAVDLVQKPATPGTASVAAPESEADIWMATLSDEPTPRISTRNRAPTSPSPVRDVMSSRGATPSVADSAVETVDMVDHIPNDHDSDVQSEAQSEADQELALSSATRHDTIANGEEFSMIFMDSIPALQPGHASMHVSREQEFGDETNMIINQTLESFRQSSNNESFLPETDEEPHNAVPVLPPPKSQPSSPIRPSAAGSPVERLSPAWARSPRRIKPLPLSRQLLTFQARRAEDSFSSVPAQILEGATPGHPSARRDSGRFGNEDSMMYEDSFSEIPEAVLEAATPRRPQPVPPLTVEEQPTRPSPMRSVSASSTGAANLQSESGRLMTPEETPSPIEGNTDADIESDKEEPEVAEAAMDVSPADQPTVPAIRQALLQPPSGQPQSSKNITPVNMTSSPQIPAAVAVSSHHLAPATAEKVGPRPALSPIIRAGQALQSVTSDNSPPAARLNTLGSPFKGSVASNHSASARSAHAWALPASHAPVPRVQLFQRELGEVPAPVNPVSEHTVGSSPKGVTVQDDDRLPEDEDQQQEDPFSEEDTQKSGGQPSFMLALAQSVFSSVTKSIPGFRSSAPSSAVAPAPARAESVEDAEADADVDADTDADAVDGADEMSWMPDSPSRTVANRRVSFERFRSSVSKVVPVSIADAEDLDEGKLEGEDVVLEQKASEPQDDTDVEEEEDIWAVEAQRPTPRATRQQPFGRRAAANRAARQGPGMTKEKETIAQPTPALQHKSESSAAGEPSGLEEYSMLSQAKQAHFAQTKLSVTTRPTTTRLDLSGFFSSPALLPGAQPKGQVPDTLRRSILQPSQPIQQEPVQVYHAASLFPSIPQKDFQLSPRKSRSSLFSPSRPSSQATEVVPSAEQTEAQPSSPQEVPLPKVAQKQNFTPRQRQTGSSLFGPSEPVDKPEATPPRMLLTREDIEKWQDESATADETSMGGSQTSFIAPFLRPLPARNVSPTKSCLRSPLKPRTPGRVVEFTSSVLSPLEQAIVREERRRRMSETSNASQLQTPQARPQSVLFTPLEEDKENQGSDIPMADASPVAFMKQPSTSFSLGSKLQAADIVAEEKSATLSSQPSSHTSVTDAELGPLSQTIWTREHWLFLEQLITLRRRGPFTVDMGHCSSHLLGKSVEARGESMQLQMWHLDVIDAFRVEVGGWPEELIAKRLFSLLVCETARNEGRIEDLKTRKTKRISQKDGLTNKARSPNKAVKGPSTTLRAMGF